MLTTIEDDIDLWAHGEALYRMLLNIAEDDVMWLFKRIWDGEVARWKYIANVIFEDWKYDQAVEQYDPNGPDTQVVWTSNKRPRELIANPDAFHAEKKRIADIPVTAIKPGMSVSIPSTVKCMDFGICHVSGKKPSKIEKGWGMFKSFKAASSFEISSLVGTVNLVGLDSPTSNNNALVRPTYDANKFWCNGFNSVDKLEFMVGANNSQLFGTGGIPTYQANSDKIAEVNDGNTTVVLRNQTVNLTVKNLGGTNTVVTTIYLMEMKKDMYELDQDVIAQENISNHLANGWQTYFDQSSSIGYPVASSSSQVEEFFLRENPVFNEYFKPVKIRKYCLQPGQVVRESFIMKAPQMLSYKHWLKNKWSPQISSTVTRYQHIVHKKGEKVWIVRQHGIMESNGGTPQYGRYSESNCLYWFNSQWEAAYCDQNTKQRTVLRTGV